jgi:hypothetical protein
MSRRERTGITGWQAAGVIAICLWIMAATIVIAPQ